MQKPATIDIGFKIDDSKLRNLDIPVEEIELETLAHNLDIPYLEQEGTDDWNLTPRMLLENLDRNPSHAKRVEEVDLKYPICIYFHKNQWIIIDGVHRYVKALKEKRTSIFAKKLTLNHLLSARIES